MQSEKCARVAGYLSARSAPAAGENACANTPTPTKTAARGVPASRLRLICFYFTTLCLFSLVVGAVAVIARAEERTLSIVVWVMLSCFVMMLVALAGWGMAIRRESRAGYTTMQGHFRHLPQVDSRTGQVVRAAGQQYPTMRNSKRR